MEYFNPKTLDYTLNQQVSWKDLQTQEVFEGVVTNVFYEGLEVKQDNQTKFISFEQVIC